MKEAWEEKAQDGAGSAAETQVQTLSLSRSAAHYPVYELFPFRGLVQGPEADLTSTAISAAPTPHPDRMRCGWLCGEPKNCRATCYTRD